MEEAYFNLKRKLQDLGYNNTLPLEAVPLVECILADLLQTTRSLQHYMDLSKEALLQRDSLMMEAEPYKCDNAKLIKQNNELHKEIMYVTEENTKLIKDSKRKIKSLSEELHRKDTLISKLQHDIRDLSLRGLCAGTLSSRNKSKRKDSGDDIESRVCICPHLTSQNVDTAKSEMIKKIQSLEEEIEMYSDEISQLRSKVEHRDNEIIRLNILLEGGRPLATAYNDCCNNNDSKVKNLMKQIHDLETTNNLLKKEMANVLEKQHEAMLRALSLADKNKTLQEELRKVDSLALKVEEDCNKRLAALTNELNFMQSRIEGLTMKNTQLQQQLDNKENSPYHSTDVQSNFNVKEKEAMQKEIRDLVDLNKTLQDKILSLSSASKNFHSEITQCKHFNEHCLTKDQLRTLFADERIKYEKHLLDIESKLSDTMSLFDKHLSKCKEKEKNPYISRENSFITDLHKKLCESEQKLLMMMKDNDELKNKIALLENSNKQNYKDVISQLNAENTELSKENIALSTELSQYKNLHFTKYDHGRIESDRSNVKKLKDEIERLTREMHLLQKDKQEYMVRYKDSVDLIDKLKRDLMFKQKQIEQLEEENCSYKMTHRTGKASAEQLREECHFLKEQIKKMQSDVIKEKTLASQIKNIQLETERSSNEIQNELLSTQRQLSLSKNTIDSLEQKIKDLQSEITSLRNDKSNLIDNIKKMDQERDKLVIELDNKTESVSVLEQKLKSQKYEIDKLENDVTNLQRKLNINKISEHKVVDSEAQIKFLNCEILRLTQQLENAIIENKHLQNSLADANGNLKVTKIELDKSKRDVEGLKQQLQHYVAEIRRIEELLSQKEAERSDMLEHFASLSVEANILENTNHSLESESASKSLQLQTYIAKIQSLEETLLDKESTIEKQCSRIASMTCRITSLENEVKLISEEKIVLEQNVSRLKQMCNDLQSQHTDLSRGLGETDSELKLYEKKIKTLSSAKAKLEMEKDELKAKLTTTEKLLSNARKEIVELKLTLQDATSETKSLQQRISSLREQEPATERILTRELDLPLLLEDTIQEISESHEDEQSSYRVTNKRFSKYTHGSTL